MRFEKFFVSPISLQGAVSKLVTVYALPQALFRVSTCTISGGVGPEFYLHILQRCDAIHQSLATPPVPNQTPSEVIANFRADESPILAISSPKRRHELVLWNISRVWIYAD